LWSSQTAWNTPNAVVTIASGQSVLLDVSPPNLKSISIAGELIFNNVDTNLYTSGIRIEQGGKLLMGSSTCRLSAKIIITFTGDASTAYDLGTNPSDGAALGKKGLAAVTGSILEIWGQDFGSNKITWTRLAQTANAGATSITLEESITGIWKVGDSIALASTDYGPVVAYGNTLDASVNWQQGSGFAEQSEDVVISAISGDGKTLTLATALKSPHFASSTYTDVRGEVGLLTRNIVFQSDATAASGGFGGHVMLRDVTRAWINGVEFKNMAQRGVMGRYPVHFHLMGAASMAGLAYLKDSSIHHNYQRCVTIHDSRGVTVQNNVAYWNNGHCFFLEDGCETDNVFDGNLGITTQPVSVESGNRLVPTDSNPSIYWITNPSNNFTNNVGVGGFHTFWFSLPVQPVGISKTKYASNTQMRPRWMPMGKFSGNIAHGAMQNGIHIDDFQKADETTEHNTSYQPYQGPYDDAKPAWQYTQITTAFDNLVVYKNRQWGIWTRGSPFLFTNVRSYDNMNGLLAVPGTNYIENSLFVGDSDNVGIPRNAGENGRSRPSQWGDASQYILGLQSYDNGGQQLFRNNVFRNFVSTPTRRAGAMGLLNSGRFLLHSRNRVSSSQFINSNQFWFQQTTTSDLNNNAQILDLDGSTTGIKGGGWIVANNSLLITPECTAKYEWNGYACPVNRAGYIQFWMTNPSLSSTNYVGSNGVDYRSTVGTAGQTPIRLTFYKLQSGSNAAVQSWRGVGSDYAANTMSYYMNAQPMQAYAVRWAYDTPSPSQLTMQIQSAASGDWILMAFPYPTGTTFVATYGSSTLQQAPSLASLYAPQASTSSSYYYYDTNSGFVFVKLENTANTGVNNYWNGFGYSDYSSDYRTLTLTASCPSGNCRSTKLTPPVLGDIDSDDYYRATLQVCQQTAAQRSTVGVLGAGTAFLAFNPTTRILKFNVYHDLGSRATAMVLKNPTTGRVTPITLSPFAPARGSAALTYNEWVDLYQGKLSLYLITSANTNGELVGKVGCEGSCTAPPQIGGQSPCNTVPGSSFIFQKGPFGSWPDWALSGWQNTPKAWNTTSSFDSTTALCGTGDNSIKVQVYGDYSGFQLGKWNGDYTIDTTTLTHLEIYMRVAAGTGRIVFNAGVTDGANKAYSFKIGDNADYINTFAIDETGWSRVKIPISVIGLPIQTNLVIKTFQISVQGTYAKVFTFWLDSIRWVPSYTDSMTAAISTSTMYSDTAICSDTGTPVSTNAPTTPSTTKAPTTSPVTTPSTTTAPSSTTKAPTSAGTTTKAPTAPSTTTKAPTTAPGTTGSATTKAPAATSSLAPTTSVGSSAPVPEPTSAPSVATNPPTTPAPGPNTQDSLKITEIPTTTAGAARVFVSTLSVVLVALLLC
jgi:cell migration-inducing and hyaluronan-binding protein